MRRKRWICGLAYTAAFGTALMLTGMSMWQDAAAKPGDPVLISLMALIAFGSCVACYGLYHDRHKAKAYVMHRLEVRTRFTRRRVVLHPAPLPQHGAWSRAEPRFS
jgi:hypothetical protein